MVVDKHQPTDYWEVMIPGGAITSLKERKIIRFASKSISTYNKADNM